MKGLRFALLSLVFGCPALLPAALTAAQASPTAEETGFTVTGCEIATPRGVVLVQPVAGGGAPQRGLRVIDPASGDETGRIEMPPVTATFPTALSGRAL